MLKGIPNLITPEMMLMLMQSGHGDEIVIADGNMPTHSLNRNVLRADGHGVGAVLEAVLKFFPLDSYTTDPVKLMAVVEGDSTNPVIWESYRQIIEDSGEPFEDFVYLDRFEFYENVRNALAVIVTSETALYGNIILKKGVVK